VYARPGWSPSGGYAPGPVATPTKRRAPRGDTATAVAKTAGRGPAPGRNRLRLAALAVASAVLWLSAAPAPQTAALGRVAHTQSGTWPAAPTALPPLPPRTASIAKLLGGILSLPFPGPETPLVPDAPASPPVPAPAPTAPEPQARERAPVASTVKVSGVACGLRLDGSGFSPDTDTIVTNAHVVAGVRQPVVKGPDGRTLAAQVVVFDPERDVAVLAVPGLNQPSLPLGSATPPEQATVYGHPFGQEAVQELPVRIESREVARVPNIYNTRAALRENLVMTGNVLSGDSGAPTVDSSGAVVGMVFAVEVLRPGRAFAIPSEDLVRPLAAPRTSPANTGPCLR